MYSARDSYTARTSSTMPGARRSSMPPPASFCSLISLAEISQAQQCCVWTSTSASAACICNILIMMTAQCWGPVMRIQAV